MKTIALIQGSPEWHAHRAAHFNASDAPAMMGCSPYTTRTQLLHQLKTGMAPEVDAATQRRFDDGHRFEALARPLAEKIIGDDLAPLVGTEGELSASFDGLTFMGDTAFEHKSLNDELRAAMVDGCFGVHLPMAYRVQMEQQCIVSGCGKVLFMASKWDGDTLVEMRHCWYAPDPKLRAEILAGWKQFAIDLAAYVPGAIIEKVVAEPVESLPAPVVQVTGQLALQDNFKVFEERLRDFLDNKLIRAPKSDQDFGDLDAQIKAMKQGRDALKSAKAQMLAQVQPVDQANKTVDMLDKLLQQACSAAEKMLGDEKARRRDEIVDAGRDALQAHVRRLNERLGGAYMPPMVAPFGDCIRGLKSLASMEDKVAGELARAKIAANETADRIQVNMAAIDAAGQPGLFADVAALVLKATDDCAAVIAARLAAEQQRLDKQQADADQRAREKVEREQQQAAAPAPTPALAPSPAPAANVVQMARPAVQTAPAPATPPTLKLGEINQRIAPLSIDAAGLAALGFTPAATDKNAKLFHEHQLPAILAAMVRHLEAVQAKLAA